MKAIIPEQQTLIPACDVASLEKLQHLVQATADLPGIGGYKIGFELVIPFGMATVVKTIHGLTKKPIIYDHQKAGTDIPDTGDKFMQVCKGVDAVILFPQAGPITQKRWIEAAQEAGMPVIIGGEMTHPGFLANDGGYLSNDAPDRIYQLAATLGVRDFVVPGNKPERISHYRELLESMGIEPTFYSPGFVSQGGELTTAAAVAGERWHAIVGRALYDAKDIRKAALALTAFRKP
ncbi:MAG: orotidine 5'-phosphate decarboxylase / HUMPS family protein [Nanoarchaeota archaeon]